MKREKEFAAAIDRRLSSLSASEARRSRIRAAAYAEKQEEKTVKTFSRSLALALVAALLLAAVAVAESANLFDLFGRRQTRYAEIAPHTTLTFTEAAVVSHPELGTVTAAIENAYFDGLSLTLAYRISHGQTVREYQPTAEELAAMQKGGPVVLTADFEENAPGLDILKAWNQALETGTPYGYRMLNVYTSDHTRTDDGIDVDPDSSHAMYDENGDYCDMRDFECPLNEALRGRDQLNIRIAVYQEDFRLWFDGTDCYWANTRAEVGTMTAVIPKNGETSVFRGEGTLAGVPCTAVAEVGALVSVVTLESEAPLNSVIGLAPAGVEEFDSWIDITALDQSGALLRPRFACEIGNGTNGMIVLNGTGAMPESLSIHAAACREDQETALEGEILLMPR